MTELLEALNRYTNIPKIFEDDDLRFKLAFMMRYILSNEIESEMTDNVNQIKESLHDSVCKIALHPCRNSRTRALDFLSKTDEQESVDAVMEILTEPNDQQIDQNFEEFLHHVLFQSHLAKKQKEYIREKLAELAISRDEVVKSRIKRLQEKYR